MNQDGELVKKTHGEIQQYCTFRVGNNFFGIPVLEVQEVINPQRLTRAPMSQKQVRGLINLRGQIVTMLGLRQLLGLEEIPSEECMNVVVRSNDSLFALMVDEIGDVLDVETASFEGAPSTLSPELKSIVKGIHKLQGQLLVVLDLEKILDI